jgi:hypothetical protein
MLSDIARLVRSVVVPARTSACGKHIFEGRILQIEKKREKSVGAGRERRVEEGKFLFLQRRVHAH